MPLLSRPAPPRYDATVERRPDTRDLLDRDPLLIPKLFVDMVPPWYKRGRWIFAGVVSASALTTLAVLVTLYGPRGAAERLESAGTAVLHGYTRLVASPDFSDPHH